MRLDATKVISVTETILRSSVFWGIAALVVAAVTLSGKFSLKGADTVLIVAWFVALIGVFRGSPVAEFSIIPRVLTTMLVVSIIGLDFYGLSGWYHRKEPSAATGSESTLQPSPTTSSSPATQPKLSAKLNQYLVGNVPRGCEFFLDVTIKNTGAPSVATGWTLGVHSSNINIDRLNPSTIVEGLTVYDAGKIIARFHGDFRLEERTSRAAIQQGLPIGGWLRFIVHGINADELAAAKKTLYFQDVNDNPYSVDLGVLSKMNHPAAYPGSGDSPFIFPGAPY